MKKLVLITIVLFTGITAINGQDIINFPSLARVVEEFDGNYKVSSDIQLQLAKTPEGWVTYELDYSAYPEIKKQNWQVLWSAKTKKFNTLNYENNEINSPKTLKKIATQSAFNYERNYFYGYDNANKDAVEHLIRLQTLNDTLTEALGRAYSAYAMEFIDPSRFRTIETSEIEYSDTSKIPANLADSFVKYVYKAIDCFHKTHQINPYYETLVGNMYIKYCNEYMYAFSVLSEYGFEEKAKQFLVPGLYGDAFLSIAKNFFNSIDNNGILFTNGDNDTYPLLYLQQVENYRKDVAVLNYSLLGSTRYIQLTQKGNNGIAPIKMTIRSQGYSNEILPYVMLTEGSKTDKTTITTIEGLINKLKNNPFSIGTTRNEISITDMDLPLAVNPTNCIKNKLVSKTFKEKTIPLTLKQILYKNDIALLDIISTNNWERPVFFSSINIETIDFAVYLKHTGLTKIFMPEKNNDVNAVDEKRISENIFKKFTFIPQESFYGKRGRGFEYCTHNMRSAYFYAAMFFYDNNDSINAKKAVLKGVEIIPHSYSPMNSGLAYGATILFNVGEADKGQKFLLDICETILGEYKEPVFVKYYLVLSPRKQQLLTDLETVSEVAIQNGYTKVLDRIDAIKKEVE